MTREERAEFKELIEEALKPFVVEFRNSSEEHVREINKLFQQSAEHYQNFRDLEDKFNNQIQVCQMRNTNSQEKQGDRIGIAEREIAILRSDVDNIKNNLSHNENKSKWSKEMIIIVVIAIVGPVAAQIIMNSIGG